MSEYIDYPSIDPSFGREYDPYPHSRSRKDLSWISQSHTNGPPRTPAIPPHTLSPGVPNVHRLTFQGSPHTPMRSQNPPPLSMPGASAFREHDRPNPARWTNAPTNVSYPASRGPSVMSPTQQSWRVDSFSPRQASTPAPETRYGELTSSPTRHHYNEEHDHEAAMVPGGFHEGPSGRYGDSVYSPTHYEEQAHPRYGETAAAPVEDLRDSSAQYDNYAPYTEEPESYVNNSAYPSHSGQYNVQDVAEHSDEDMEEEIVSVGQMHNEGSEGSRRDWEGERGRRPSPESFKVFEQQENSTEPRPKGRSFTDRFMNIFSRKSSKSGSRQPTSQIAMPIPHPASPILPRSQPPRANLARKSSHSSHVPSQLSRGSPSGHRRSPARPANPEPNTTADFSRVTGSTASSQGGPYTPDQSTNAPGGLPDSEAWPNPHEATRLPQPQLTVLPPEMADIRPTVDYDVMSEDPVYDDQQDYTFTSRINTIGRFLSDLVHLPFKTLDTVTVPYQPGDSRRAQYAVQKPGKSWYAKEKHEKLDLLATPTQIMRSPIQRPRAAMPRQTQIPRSTPQHIRAAQAPREHRSPRSPPTRSPPAMKAMSLDAATAIRSNPTPGSLTTHGGMIRLASPGLSSHEQGQHSGSIQYIYASPQPLYLMPGTQLNQQTAGQSEGAAQAIPTSLPFHIPGSRSGSPQQAVPVYVLTTPGPLATVQVPGSSPKKHRKHHSSRSSTQRRRHREDRKSTSSTSSPPPVPTIPRLDLLSS